MTVHRLVPDGVDWRPVDGEMVALDRRTSQYLALNATGTLLWEALLGGATTDELVELVTGRWEVDADRARADVEAFLATLAERHLLGT
jgi:hypothetical protein